MLLIIAVILFVLFGGLGFVFHLLWIGLLIALAVAVFHFFTGDRRSSRL
jgi:hypothetical protein